jgi:2-dehydropantoate 2-reductase
VEALREGARVMSSRGVAAVNLPGYPVAWLARVARLPASWTRAAMIRFTAREPGAASSMSQDLRKGRGRTEIDEINGAVVRLGRERGLATPANDRLCALVREAAS